jgi:glycosyltransferase involved in cell wall biosynthesis
MKNINKNKNKKILYLLFGTAPSSIVRATIYNDVYKNHGYEVVYFKAYSSLIELFRTWINNKNYLSSIGLFLSLVQKCIMPVKKYIFLSILNKYDAIVIVKYTSSSFMRKVKNKAKNKPVLYEFDDAIWLPLFMGEKEFQSILKLADFVSCDNTYLADKAKKYNSNVFVLNGPVNPPLDVLHSPRITNNENKPVEIGWLGSPLTLFYLYSIYDVLMDLHRKYQNIRLTLVGCGNRKELIPYFDDLNVTYIPYYSGFNMYDKIKSFDIGLYPIYKNELSLGRGCLKAVVYMSSAIPVVATRIGENNNLIRDGINGFLASTSDEWFLKLSQLIENQELRNTVGMRGYNSILEHYSVDACFRQLENNFLDHIQHHE